MKRISECMEPWATIALHFVRRRFRDDHVVRHDDNGMPITVGFLRDCFLWYFGVDVEGVRDGIVRPVMPSDWLRGLLVDSGGEVYDEFGNHWKRGAAVELPIPATSIAA